MRLLAALSDGDGAAWAAAITVVGALAVAIWNSHKARVSSKAAELELKPNSGKSMRDSMTRVEDMLVRNSADFLELCSDVRQIETSMRADVRELRSDVRELRGDFDRVAAQYLQRFIDLEDRLILIESPRPSGDG